MPSDFGLFYRQFRENFETTGAIAPSSRFLGNALARYVVGGEKPLRILEVGPGTGAVTACILRRLRPQDELHLVELNTKFVELLKTKFSTDSSFQKHAQQVEVIHDRVEALMDREPYDVIVSGLPLNNFEPALILSILETFQKLLKRDGTLSFFEYMFFRGLRSVKPGRMRDVSNILQPWLQQYEFGRDWVWMNLPPAWAHHIRFQEPRDQGKSS